MQLHQYPATQICAALSAGDIQAKEVIHHQLERIQRLNPVINAVVTLNENQPTSNMRPLAGLPITLKDQIYYRGMACTFGSERFKGFHPTQTASAVERLLNAGAQVMGKTNLPPLSMDFQCSNTLFGTTNNPWNLEYTPGGSSGGGAAAIAGGMSFVDIGTDLSGSLRIPASFCGVFSLLPSEDAIPIDGTMPNQAAPLKHFARMGPIARNCDDLDLVWTHMNNQPDVGQKEFKMPKVNWSVDSGGIEVCKSIVKCFESAKNAWEESGVHVVQAQPKDFDFKRARRAFGEIMGFETSALMSAPVRFLSSILGRASARRSPEFIANVMLGYRHNKSRLSNAIDEKKILSDAIDAFLADNSVWVLPVTATSVFKHMAPTSDRNGVRDYALPMYINEQPVNYFDAMAAFTTPISLTGHPVVTLPIGFDGNGLPIGAQLIGLKDQEKDLIETAKRLHNILKPHQCPMFTNG
ncbi:amidase [Microbulbifer sp. DLAB2-AA]|uniref:amidase n=1 Tax=Microbulbifer sp. DLAB2-AA TaxID=3243394 RepID=UPI00403972F6